MRRAAIRLPSFYRAADVLGLMRTTAPAEYPVRARDSQRQRGALGRPVLTIVRRQHLC
jgi:hypothetical protein